MRHDGLMKTFTLTVLGMVLIACNANADVLDAFDDVSKWKPITSEGAVLILTRDETDSGPSMRLDYDFKGQAGFVLAERELYLDLPENYEFRFRISAISPNQNLEFKLMDEQGDSVWWRNQVNYTFPSNWSIVRLRKRDIRFAWGPAGGGDLKRAGTLQIGIAAYTGGKGTVWIDDLEFRELPPVHPYSGRPTVAYSGGVKGDSAKPVPFKPTVVWRQAEGGAFSRTLDFGHNREYGGFVLDWEPGMPPADAKVEVSADGEEWETIHKADRPGGKRWFVAMPDTESRFLRLTFTPGPNGVGVSRFEIKDLSFSESPNAFMKSVALASPVGYYPRAFLGRNTAWTVVGFNGDWRESLIDIDGRVELDKQRPSVEPFLLVDDKLFHWANARAVPELRDSVTPSVTWNASVQLTIEPFVQTGTAERLFLRYRIRNKSSGRRMGRLFLAVRPFQVNPPWQFLNVQGGVAPIRSLEWNGKDLSVDGRERIQPITLPHAFGAMTFDEGALIARLANNDVPTATSITDPSGWASGAFVFDFDLEPGEEYPVTMAVLREGDEGKDIPLTEALVGSIQAKEHAGRVSEVSVPGFEGPPAAKRLIDIMRSNVAYILINRDGPGIQPGSRSYDRSWMRDGALTSASLLRVGRFREVREFIKWYSEYVRPDGWVPCVVDRRGADPVAEHDSHGQFLYIVNQYYRFTSDKDFLRAMYPVCRRVAEKIIALTQTRKTNDYITGPPEKRALYGLMPESISHEGYSVPKHSYWDNFFALRGLKDAASMAKALGETADTARFTEAVETFRKDFYNSVRLVMAEKKIDYFPGCAELGDFDATSTAVGVYPCGELRWIPKQALKGTFDRYLTFFDERASGKLKWRDYTPYEIRSCSTLLMMDRPRDAHRLAELFLRDMTPPAWNQWGEIVWRDKKTGQWIGDMPHTWVGSEFVKFVRNILAYEDETDESLVIGAGILPEWLKTGPIRVTNLPTYYGNLSYRMELKEKSLTIDVEAGVDPSGAVWIPNLLDRQIKSVTVNGDDYTTVNGRVGFRTLPAKVVFTY